LFLYCLIKNKERNFFLFEIIELDLYLIYYIEKKKKLFLFFLSHNSSRFLFVVSKGKKIVKTDAIKEVIPNKA
jgi:hypothetical protein